MASQDRGSQGDGNRNTKVMTGAAVVGGVAATLVAGPVIGVVAAGGAAYAATRSDKVGDVAKSTGEAALAVGGKAAEINKEHKITQKVGDGLKSAGSALQQFDAKHDVTGKLAAGWTSAMSGISKALQPKAGNPPPPPPPGHSGAYPPR